LATVITALAGGVGAARLLAGLVRVVPPAAVTAVVNTGDDTIMHGLHVSPDLDTVMYTLAGLSDPGRGWGLAGETWTVMDALERLGGEAWFRLGDRDLATHLLRTDRLRSGATLTEVTVELAHAYGVDIGLVPMADDPIQTRLTLVDGPEIAFQEYFVRRRHDVAVASVRYEGASGAKPAPGVLDAIEDAQTVIICPSNPVLSIGPILALPGVRDALAGRRQDVVAVSPIIAGKALKGPADRLLQELGHECSAVGVALLYRDVAATLVIDDADASLAPRVEEVGLRCVVAPTVMSSADHAAALARVVLAGG
jgi:LPPG:FO 2-phospho-L-lactate transferase